MFQVRFLFLKMFNLVIQLRVICFLLLNALLVCFNLIRSFMMLFLSSLDWFFNFSFSTFCIFNFSSNFVEILGKISNWLFYYCLFCIDTWKFTFQSVDFLLSTLDFCFNISLSDFKIIEFSCGADTDWLINQLCQKSLQCTFLFWYSCFWSIYGIFR